MLTYEKNMTIEKYGYARVLAVAIRTYQSKKRPLKQPGVKSFGWKKLPALAVTVAQSLSCC